MRFPFALLVLLALPLSADLVVPQTSAPRILIPVAGDAPGANGTHFRSDVTIVNLRDAEQRVMLLWYPQDGTPVSRTITIGSRSGISSEDFVRNVLQLSGIGAIDIVAVNADNAVDPFGQLHATARIWTPQPNVVGGEMSQPFPALVFASAQPAVKWILGMRRDAEHRLNVGIVNPSSATQRFRVTIIGATSSTPGEVVEIEVPAQAVRQRNMTGASDVAQILVQNISGTGATTTWHAWASSVHNVTGDAWSQTAFAAPPAQ
ncbi:MAG TPA: hypothetical protein VEK11_00220 [Thermoanaerobaculia bacterium]|nr:hypothetical protein [Thermoanaerobaculia bacterium]